MEKSYFVRGKKPPHLAYGRILKFVPRRDPISSHQKNVRAKLEELCIAVVRTTFFLLAYIHTVDLGENFPPFLEFSYFQRLLSSPPFTRTHLCHYWYLLLYGTYRYSNGTYSTTVRILTLYYCTVFAIFWLFFGFKLLHMSPWLVWAFNYGTVLKR